MKRSGATVFVLPTGSVSPITLDAETAEAVDAELRKPASGSDDESMALAKQAQRLLCELAATDEALTRDLAAVALPLADELRVSFTRAGFVTLDGILSSCVDLLLEHPPVRREEARAIELLLVDEFQDTDPLQCEIVLLLAERGATETHVEREL